MNEPDEKAQEASSDAQAGTQLTSSEVYERFKALTERIEKAATKTMLVYFVANGTVVNGIGLGATPAEMDAAETRLLERLKEWGKTARSASSWKRTTRLLQKIQENREAEEAGRRPPHKFKAPKRRKKARRAKS